MRPGLVTMLLVIGACIVPEHSNAANPKPRRQLPPVGPFPDAVCDEAARMDIFISADGTLWECVCEKLQDDLACDWFEQGTVNGKQIRRLNLRKRHHVIIRYALPRVIA